MSNTVFHYISINSFFTVAFLESFTVKVLINVQCQDLIKVRTVKVYIVTLGWRPNNIPLSFIQHAKGLPALFLYPPRAP